MKPLIIPIDTFAPDASRASPGLRECVGMQPTVRGMITAPTFDPLALTGTPAGIKGIDTISDNLGQPQLYAGTQTSLHWVVAGAFANISRTGNYALSAGYYWRFLSFGDSTLAFRKDVETQVRTSGIFANLATAPQALLMERVGLQVIAFNVYDAGWGDFSDGWWCCGEADVLTWTPSVSAQSNRGRLYATPGAILAAKTLGDRVVAYKLNGAYVGTYDGPPKVFRWDLAVGDEGAIGPNAVALIYPQGRPVHFVVGPQRMFLFDGYRAQILGVGEISEFFYNSLDSIYRGEVTCVVEASKNLVHIFYTASGNVNLNQSIIYNYATGKWGAGRNVPVAIPFQHVKTVNTSRTTVPAYVGTDGGLNSLTKVADYSVVSQMFTQSYGSDSEKTLVKRIRPRVENRSNAFTLDDAHVHFDSIHMGIDYAPVTSPMVNNRIDVLNENRWHAEYLTIKGHVELSALAVDVKVVSDE